MAETVIVSMARTPFGRLGGGLSSLKAMDLGAVAIAETLKRAGISGEQLDMVIIGQVLTGGCGQIPGRQAAVKAGVPYEVPCINVNKVCISSLSAVTMADQVIRAGDADIIMTGGMESMSQGPYYIPRARYGYRMGNAELVDGMIYDGLWDAFQDWHMGEGTDRVAEEFSTRREDQDLWAFRSHQRAAQAEDEGMLAEEIVPVEVPQKKGDTKIVDKDEHIRRDTTIEKLSRLSPAFRKEGTVTAGNASGINDGAGAILVMTREKAEELGVEPLAKVVSHGMVGEKSPYLATVPANSTKKALEKAGLKVSDVDLFEINEAFAAVCWKSSEMLGLDPKTAENINVNGGAIALGHPIGASGSRIIMTLVSELRRRGGKYGVAAICGGGGQGDAVVLDAQV